MSDDKPKNPDAESEVPETAVEEEEVDFLAVDPDDLGDGLVMDERQSQELQSIFLATLPQYLEPVEEMLGQLFAGDDDTVDAEAQKALRATLASLSTAAERVGLDSIYDRLDKMNTLIAGLGDIDRTQRTSVTQQIRRNFGEIRGMTTGDEPAQAPAAPKQSLIAAIRAIGDVDEGVLSRLTAAGIVTMEQLRMANPDEIVAVSGLEASVVDRLLLSLAPDVDSAAASAANVVELRSGALQSQLELRLREQVDAEAALEEVEADVQRLEAEHTSLRRQLQSSERERDTLRDSLREADDKSARLAATLARSRRSREDLLSRRADADERIAGEEQRILSLREERQSAVSRRDQFGQRIARLEQRIARMLELTSRE